jgi:hypothetical protein
MKPKKVLNYRSAINISKFFNRLVCYTYKRDDYSQRRCMDRTNSKKFDNRVTNLRWCTHQEDSGAPCVQVLQVEHPTGNSVAHPSNKNVLKES